MIKSSLYAAILLFGASSMSVAGPIELEASQMDAVTAGAFPVVSGVGSALALGAFGLVGTNANSGVTSSHPAAGSHGGAYYLGYMGAADAVGAAYGAGPGAAVSTSADTSTTAPTYGVVIGRDVDRQVLGASLSGSAVAVVSTVFFPIFR